MNQAITQRKVKSFVWKNWYKLAFLSFCLYIFLQKDLSFQINLNAPIKMEEQSSPQEYEESPQPRTTKKELEKITDNKRTPQIATTSPNVLQQFGLGTFEETPSRPEAFEQLSKVSDDVVIKFLKRFAHVAISERKKYGVPSSIILGNALLHSISGQSDLAKNGNNHFAIPCNNNWTGAQGTYGGMCYRHYDNAWSSFRDHSKYITSNQFESLRNLGSTNYKEWAASLERKSFSSEPELASKLIKLIEQYQLYELDAK